jgi:hypothetical protein
MQRGTIIPVVVLGLVATAVCACRSRRSAPEPAKEQAPATAPAVLTFTAAASDASSPAPVVLRDIASFTSATGPWALIEIVNQSDRPMVPHIVFHYRDGAGQAVSQGELVQGCPVPALVMRPGEKVPCVTKGPPSAATATYEIQLHNENAEGLARDMRTDLQVVGAQLGADSQVQGFVENRTKSTLTAARVTVAFYNAAGRIVGMGDVDVDPREIKPGARAPFRVAAKLMLAPAASFSASAWTLSPRAGR